MATKNFFVHDGLKVRGNTLLNGATYSDSALSKLHVKSAANGSGANLTNVNGLIIENSGSSNTNYALKLATGAGNILSVTNAGRMGIGTTTPNVSGLTVVGDISASGNIYGDIADLQFTDLTVTGDLSVTGDSYFAALSSSSIYNTGDIVTVGDVEADEFIGSLRGAVTFKAQAGEAISKGDVVYISGISGNTTVVSKADADDANKMPAFGIAQAAASLNNPVTIVNFGSVTNLNTSGFPEGTELFVGTTAGALVSAAPTGENSAIQKIAKVTRQDNSAGSMTVMGAGRSNAVPNLNEGRLFVGNSSNQAVADGTIHVDIANSRVGIGTTVPDRALHVKPTSDVPAIKVGYDGTQGNGSLIEFDNGYTQKFYVGMSDTYSSRDFVIAEVSLGSSTDATNPKYVFNGNGDGAFYITDAADNDTRILLNTNGDSYLSGGYVGIGITNPSCNLHVRGCSIYLHNNIDTNNTCIHVHNTSNGNAGIKMQNTDGSWQIIANDRLRFYDDDSSLERLSITSSGNIGVGTTDPTAVDGSLALEVLGLSGAELIVGSTAASTAANDFVGGLAFRNNDASGSGVNLTPHYSGIKATAGDAFGNSTLEFYSGRGRYEADTPNMVILGRSSAGDANVGIGTTEPGEKLTVSGNISASGVIYADTFCSNSGSCATIDFNDNLDVDGYITATQDISSQGCFYTSSGSNVAILANNYLRSCASGTFYFDNATVGQSFQFRTSCSSALDTTAMTITSAGNVGIGTATPGSALDINGTLKIQNNNSSSNYMEFTAPGSWNVVGSRPVIKVGGTEKMRASANGVNIGGSTDATHTLDVDGAAHFSSDVTISGDILNCGDLTVNGNLTVQGTTTTLNTTVTATSAMCISNAGTGPALQLNQTGSQPIVDFQDDGTSTFYIEDGGNVGIGTTDPSNKLQLDVGSCTYLGSGSNGLRICSGSRNTLLLRTGCDYSYAGISGTGALLYSYDTLNFLADTNNPINFSTGGSTRMTVASSGNVGIGTTSPSYLLHTYGATADQLLLERSNANDVELVIKNSEQSWVQGIDRSESNHYVISTGDNVAANKKIVIQTGGNVGIGTSDVRSKLFIAGGGVMMDYGNGGSTDGAALRINSNANEAFIQTNAYYNAAVKHARSGASSTIGFKLDATRGGDITFTTAPSAAADANMSQTEVMTIKQSGYVGIGVTNPDFPLEVAGAIGIDDYIYHNGDHNTYLQFNSDAILLRTGGQDRLKISNTETVINDDTLPHDFRVEGDTDTALFFTDASTDRVGIGTTNPVGKLHVKHTTTSGAISGVNPALVFNIQNSSIGADSYYGNVRWARANSNGGTPSLGIIARTDSSNPASVSHLAFYTEEGTSSTLTERMVIENGGNVGIGTTSPLSELHIEKGLTGDSSQLRITNGAGATVRMGITGSGANDSAHIKTNSGEDLEFQIGQAADAATPSVIFKSGGDVGIGTPSPSTILDVNGTITLSSDVEHQLAKRTQSCVTAASADTTELRGRNIDLYAFDDINLRAGTGDKINLFAQGGSTKFTVCDDVVVNPALCAINFRVGGDTDANLIRANGALDKVGIGVAFPNEKFTVSGNISASGIIYGDTFCSNSGSSSTIDFNDNLDVDGYITASNYIATTNTSTTSAMVMGFKDQFKRTYTTEYSFTQSGAGLHTFNLGFPADPAGTGWKYKAVLIIQRQGSAYTFGSIEDNSYIYREIDNDFTHRSEDQVLVSSGLGSSNSVVLSGDITSFNTDVLTSSSATGSSTYDYYVVRYPLDFNYNFSGTNKIMVHLETYNYSGPDPVFTIA